MEPLIDSHAHLDFPDFDADRDQVLRAAAAAGVETIITIGAGGGAESARRAVELAKNYPQVFATVGVHPHDAKAMNPATLRELRRLAEHSDKVKAIGEIGLDFAKLRSDKATQLQAFRDQLQLANELKLPVVIHDREAHAETYALLREQRPVAGGVMHCFSGDAALAKEAMALGFYISIPGVVTFKNAGALTEVVKTIPLEKMLLETDCPFLAPEPHRGKRNQPAYVRHVAETVARLRGLTVDDVARVTTKNAIRVFGLPAPARQPRIAYRIRDSLYLNVTNRCNNACTFCPKNLPPHDPRAYEVKGHYLRLEQEPSEEEIKQAVGNPGLDEEVVFCGFGEPLLRLETVKAVAGWLKEQGARVRVDTDGLANKTYGRDVTAELKGRVDAIAVSLNAADAETYNRFCPGKYGEEAFAAVKDFIRAARRQGIEVTASVVGLPGLDLEACRRLAEDELGVKFRVRPYDEVG
jgi:TatD DNase family protein